MTPTAAAARPGIEIPPIVGPALRPMSCAPASTLAPVTMPSTRWSTVWSGFAQAEVDAERSGAQLLKHR